MKITTDFAPIRIVIETEKEKDLLYRILDLAYTKDHWSFRGGESDLQKEIRLIQDRLMGRTL